MERQFILFLSCLVLLILGVLPLVVYFFAPDALPFIVVAFLNLSGWLLAGMLYCSRRHMLDSINQTFKEVGLNPIRGDFAKKLSAFLYESIRYHRASYGFMQHGDVRPMDLGENLQKIVKLAYDELPVVSAEVALYDAHSSLWSQSMLIGEPTSFHAQALLFEAAAGTAEVIEEDNNSPSVLVEELRFADTVFGQLRVELSAKAKATKSDRQVLYLLATQGALMLVDARFTEELLRMRRLGEESLRAKTGFLANLSHEIRGPLGTILNGVELSLEGLCGPLSQSQRETLEIIKESSDHLLDLVNDVLDYAKVEAGVIEPQAVSISVKELVSDLCTVVRSQAVGRSQTLTLESIDDTLGIRCDKRHARQMLINLLTNAIKYTPTGGCITVSAERFTAERVKISVADTGIGIAAQDKHKVFEPFQRIESKYTETEVGTGLGMPLTRRLAEVNGGSVDFISVEGTGSTFWIVLPTAVVERASDSLEDIEQEVAVNGRGECILLLEPDIRMREMLSTYLANQQFNVCCVDSAASMMEALKTKPVELAIIESDNPVISGEEAVAAIRSFGKTVSLPIVLLTARAFVFDIEQFLRLGVDRCLAKPVSMRELAQTSRRLIDEKLALQAIQLEAGKTGRE